MVPFRRGCEFGTQEIRRETELTEFTEWGRVRGAGVCILFIMLILSVPRRRRRCKKSQAIGKRGVVLPPPASSLHPDLNGHPP